MLYDSILLIGIVLISLMPAPILSEAFRLSTTGKWLTRAYILLVLFIFFGWFWTHRGQTLGMRAWRIKVISDNNGEISWGLALKRFIFAFAGLALGGIGFIWSLFHPQNMTLHDLYSGSKMIMLEKRKKLSRHSPEQEHSDK